MNKRSIVIGICLIAIAVTTLSFGRTARLSPISLIQKQNEARPKAPASKPAVSVSLNENKELTADSAAQTGSAVPDAIVYSYLFSSILMFKEKAAEEEKQGRLGAPYTKAIQASLKLDDATAKALDDAASAWKSKKQVMEVKAEALMSRSAGVRPVTEGESRVVEAETEAELQVVYEQLNDSVLDARESVRESLGEEGFAALEKTIDENVTSKIESKPFDPNDASLVRSRERISPYKRFNEAPPEAVMDSGRLMLRHDAPQTTSEPEGTKKSTSKSKRGEVSATKGGGLQPIIPFNFCFFGGVVFYGTFVWLVPSIDRIIQVSFTQLDFCAGLRADPFVYALLQSPFAFDEMANMGRSFVRPAVAEVDVLALPSTPYAAYAEHWILHCFEICEWIFIDAYTIFFQTPQCVNGATSGFGVNFETCPGPSPSPTPTPTVKIDSVGFTGDFLLRHWDTNPTQRKRIDFPDGSEPTWSRSANPKSAVAYKRGTNPTMFATLVVTPAQSVARPAQIRVKKGTAIVATKSADIGAGLSSVKDITVTFSALEAASVVKRGDYEFIWEVSFDNGSNWQNAGKSGSHKIYWTWDNPKSDIWRNQVQQTAFPTADGDEQDTLYDEAMQRSAAAAEGKATVDEIVDKITKRVASQLIYDPCRPDPADVPLRAFGSGGKAQCSTNANLLRGLLRTIGIDATAKYFWGGNAGTNQILLYDYNSVEEMSFKVKRNPQNEGTNALNTCPNVERDPHFQFHALVEVGGKVYDPSYGLTNQDPTKSDTAQIKVLEVSNWPSTNPRFLRNDDVPANRVVTNELPFFMNDALRKDTDSNCNELPPIGTFPNPIDNAEFYVAQHYLDFLNRVADPEGLAFWAGTITECGADAACVEHKRVMASLAFFLSIEYQERGYFVHRFIKAAYGRRPLFDEFLTEMGKISPDFQTPQMENDKTVYGEEFVETQAFKDRYPFEMTFDQYVDALFVNAGVTPDAATRNNLISGLAAGAETRASVLRKVVDYEPYRTAEFRPAFVEMCYFGYLRRDPDTLGFNFWLQSLNNSNGDLYHAAKAFILSLEYRARFGQP
jgi:hypothetical protein